MWFLKRAEHLTFEEFKQWWLNEHALDVARFQSPHLRKYVVNLKADESQLGAGTSEQLDWDGIAEQWFESEEAYHAAYSAKPSPTRDDTLAHTSRFARFVVEEHDIASPPPSASPR